MEELGFRALPIGLATKSQSGMKGTLMWSSGGTGLCCGMLWSSNVRQAEALAELRENCHSYGVFCNLIKTHWKHHNTFVGFAMDHGCHEIDGENGSHGLDMDEDINIVHLYKGFKKQ